MNSGGYIYQDAKSRGIYLALFTDPKGDSCFNIYEISWIKMKKVNFCKLKTSLSRNFVYNLQTFRGFCQVHFTILLQIQHENNFLPTSKHQQAIVCRFLGVCLYECFIYRSNFVFRKCHEARRHLDSVGKMVNSQGYSELRKPIKTREKCYSLIWSILIWDIHGLRWKLGLGLEVGLGQGLGLGLLHQFYLKVRVRVSHVIKI